MSNVWLEQDHVAQLHQNPYGLELIRIRVPILGSLTLGVGTGPAIAPRSNAAGAQLLNPPTLYKALHTQTNITSHANGENGSFRMYSRIPLHLRSDALDPNSPNK